MGLKLVYPKSKWITLSLTLSSSSWRRSLTDSALACNSQSQKSVAHLPDSLKPNNVDKLHEQEARPRLHLHMSQVFEWFKHPPLYVINL